jgi:hypothetical protein
MSEARAFQLAGPDGQRFIVGEGEGPEDLQASGEWLATTDPVEVQR